MRCVRKKWSIPKEEGLVFGHRMIDESLYRFHSRATDLETVVAMSTTGFWETSSHPMSKATVSEGTLPPLSALMTEVALFTKQIRHRVELIEV